MTYRPRFYVPGLSVHITRRGNNRTAIYCDDCDRLVFLDALRQGSRKHGMWIHSLVLMTNHYHLLATPTNPDAMPLTMRTVGQRYVRYFNRKYGRIGTLWAGRYQPLPIESAVYWRNCLRYIAQNPVRAKMVTSPDAYEWSSYRKHANGKDWEWLDDHPVFQTLGSTTVDRQMAYRALCATALGDLELAQQRYVGADTESRIVAASDWYGGPNRTSGSAVLPAISGDSLSLQ